MVENLLLWTDGLFLKVARRSHESSYKTYPWEPLRQIYLKLQWCYYKPITVLVKTILKLTGTSGSLKFNCVDILRTINHKIIYRIKGTQRKYIIIQNFYYKNKIRQLGTATVFSKRLEFKFILKNWIHDMNFQTSDDAIQYVEVDRKKIIEYSQG